MTERRALLLALALNMAMAVIETVAGLLTLSVVLLADAVDFVEDSAVYILALTVGGQKREVKRRFGLLIAALMAMPGLGALVQVWRQLGAGAVPDGQMIWVVSTLALAVNLSSAAVILAARRGPQPESIGLRAAWLSSRNDAVANIAMIGAGFLVGITQSGWPDIVVGLGIAALHLSGAIAILRRTLSGTDL
jgi:Co/Zn/Cd efflux system component